MSADFVSTLTEKEQMANNICSKIYIHVLKVLLGVWGMEEQYDSCITLSLLSNMNAFTEIKYHCWKHFVSTREKRGQ